MSDAPRYTTLRDYLRVLRQQRLLIGLIGVVFAAAACGVSLTQQPTYQATAIVSFRDPSTDLNLLNGQNIPQSDAPATIAAANAELVTRNDVVQAAQRNLGSKLTTAELAGLVSASVASFTNFVNITATTGTAEGAARTANAFALAATRAARQEEKRRFAKAIKAAKRQVTLDRKNGAIVTSAGVVAQQRLQSLETAKDVLRPAQVERRADIPPSPSSPRTVRNTVLGGLVGLVLGILAAFARDSLDRRLRRSADAEEEVGAPVLGKVSETALGRIGFTSNGSESKLTDADLEAFRLLRTNLGFLDVDRKVGSVLVTSGLPEEGKSTVAASLATAAALAGKRTLLVECDLRRPSLAQRFNIERSPGLTDYIGGGASPKEILQAVPIGRVAENGAGPAAGPTSVEGPERPAHDASTTAVEAQPVLVCIAAGSPIPHPAELLGSSKLGEFFEQVTRAYDLVVLDTSPLLSVVDALELVPRVDSVLICVRMARTTREELRATKAALDHLPARPTGLVVTGVRKGDEEAYGYYSYGPAYGSDSPGKVAGRS